MAEFTGTFERKEVKYRLNTMQVRAIKQALSAHMAPDEYGQTSITSVYYDTPNRDMISRSLEKPAYKEKLRLRTYGPRNASAPVYVELKKKHEGIVYKRRIAASEPAARLLMVGMPYERRFIAIRWPTRRLKRIRARREICKSRKRLRHAFVATVLCFLRWPFWLNAWHGRLCWMRVGPKRRACALRSTSAFGIAICSHQKESVLRCLCSLRARRLWK